MVSYAKPQYTEAELRHGVIRMDTHQHNMDKCFVQGCRKVAKAVNALAVTQCL